MAIGDHLAVSPGLFQHHAVDLGHGCVVQYGAGHGGRDSHAVQVACLEHFSAGATLRVVPNPAAFPPEEIVERALSRLGESDYRLFGNNCEHFVNWCRTGEAVSRQVDRAIERTGAVLTKVATRSLAKTASPWLLAADAAQFGAEVAASRLGANDDEAQQTGQWVGAGTSIGIGAAIGGPVGALVGLGYWTAGEWLGKSLTR